MDISQHYLAVARALGRVGDWANSDSSSEHGIALLRAAVVDLAGEHPAAASLAARLDIDAVDAAHDRIGKARTEAGRSRARLALQRVAWDREARAAATAQAIAEALEAADTERN